VKKIKSHVVLEAAVSSVEAISQWWDPMTYEKAVNSKPCWFFTPLNQTLSVIQAAICPKMTKKRKK